MAKQTIISISREYGSGGHDIAEKIANDFGFKFYDRSMLDEIAKEKNMNVETIAKYDEKPRNFILSRSVAGYSNSPEEVIANMQFEFIKNKAESGESFVVVGRCAESILANYDNLITIFIEGDKESKIKRIVAKYKVSEQEAYDNMIRHDKKRKRYHNRYSEHKWGDLRFYDICINSSKLGEAETVSILEEYIKARIEKQS